MCRGTSKWAVKRSYRKTKSPCGVPAETTSEESWVRLAAPFPPRARKPDPCQEQLECAKSPERLHTHSELVVHPRWWGSHQPKQCKRVGGILAVPRIGGREGM